MTNQRPATTGVDDWFREEYPRLRRFAAVVAPPTVAPDDLLQDAVVRLLKSGKFAEVADASAYLCRIMTNLASDRRRRWQRGRRIRARLGSATHAVETSYPSDLTDLASLSPSERGAVYLHDIEGRPFDEVALLLGCSPAAARQAAVRGRSHLRDQIEEST